jgi:hypothetical protein
VKTSGIVFVCGSLSIAFVLAIGLSGCSSSAGSDAALAKAKATTLSVESKMASFIPKSSVISLDQPTRSKVLFACLGNSDKSYWPSTMTVSVKPGLNTSNVLYAIGSYWTGKNGWTATNGTAPDGTPTMDVTSNSGYNFTAEFAQGPVFTVTAISACFPNAGLAGRTSY